MGSRRRTYCPRNITSMLILAACLPSYLSYSQKIINVDFEVIESTIKISYDIDECYGNKTVDVRLSLGKDGRLTEITHGLGGDIRDVACGPSKVITWEVLADRDELNGRIYFAVEIERVNEEIPQIHEEIQQAEEIQEPQRTDKGKYWRRRSWKADKGYVGGSLGIFAPYQSSEGLPYNPQQNGFFLNTTVGYLPSLLLGVSTTIYIYGAPSLDRFKIALWKSCGVMIGPLISIPIGNRIKWEFRPQIGYSAIYADSKTSDLDSARTVRSGVAYNIGTGLRLNLGKRTCYLLNVEYLSATRKFEDYQIKRDIGLLGVSFGIAFRFY